MSKESAAKVRLDYKGKMILAPMVRIGTLPTRLLALEYGADIVYTEEIIDWRLLRSRRVENRLLDTVDYVDMTDDTLVLRFARAERGHVVLQIGTSDPDRAVKVAKMVQDDVDGIDVNMGCPKAFSLKGGMGAALLTQPQKVEKILCSLVKAVDIPVTCKIRILSNLQDTLNLVDVIQQTGVAALAVHGRTKEERPNNKNHVDVIQKVVEHASIPVIANGGSANNREGQENTFEGIQQFWKTTGASSVMVARAAEWNISVFSDKGKQGIYEIVGQYLDYAIKYDQPYIVSKYSIQQILGGDQETVIGKQFLSASTMHEMCLVFGKGEAFKKKQEWLRTESERLGIGSYGNTQLTRVRRDVTVAPRKRKLSEVYCSDDISGVNEVTEMFCPFVRGHYPTHLDIPKTKLLMWCRKHHKGQECYENAPLYHSWQKDKMFRSVVVSHGQAFSSESWEKSKKWAEQAAAIVALHCLGVKAVKLDEGASTDSGIVYVNDDGGLDKIPMNQTSQ